MTTARCAGAAAVVAVTTAGLYWVFLSPYSQFFGRYPWRGRDGERVVALTFDDGPNEPYTSQIAGSGSRIRPWPVTSGFRLPVRSR